MTKFRPTSVITADELTARHWYSVIDDEIGGYAIATTDRPTSQIDPMSTRERVIAWVTYKNHADQLTALHNRELDDRDHSEQS